MITAEAIETFQSICRQGEQTQFLEPPAEPLGVYYVRSPGLPGGLERRVAVASPSTYEVNSLKGLIDAMQAFGETAPAVDSWLIFVGDAKLTAVANESKGDPLVRHCVSFFLHESPQFHGVRRLRAAAGHSQSEFIHLLRIELHGAVPNEFLDRVRLLHCSRAAETRAVKNTGAETFGQEVRRQMQLGEDGASVPEAVQLCLSVYDEFAEFSEYQELLECAVEVELAEQGPLFYLFPLAGELSRVIRETESVLYENITKMVKERELGKPVSIVRGRC